MNDLPLRERRVAGVYLRAERFFVYPYSRTTSGVLIGTEPVTTLAGSATDEEIGHAVQGALGNYRSGVRHPSLEEFDQLQAQDPVLTAAGVKSLATFSKGALACRVSQEAGAISVVPSRPGRTKGSFLSALEFEVYLDVADGAAALGGAVRRALEQVR